MGFWTAQHIWNVMPREQREQAAAALWTDEHMSREQRLAAIAPWLSSRGMRIAFLEKLPRTRRAALIAQAGVPEDTAMQALMSFHLVHRRELLAAFLDALEIEHEDGLIKDASEIEPPDDKKVGAAIKKLRKSFPEDQVDLYLETLTAADPETWSAVARAIPEQS
ncbi:MAG: hypothetical protein JSV80_07465 [Acidobacteriota bacterium]|nr:MAG: hypothetical protein JSV80_07465 [Acidobacteriota bacterium]